MNETTPINTQDYKAILQGMIFASETPLTLKEMHSKLNAYYKKQNAVSAPESEVDVVPEAILESAPGSVYNEELVGSQPTSAEVYVAPESVSELTNAELSETSAEAISSDQIKAWLSEIMQTFSEASFGFELVYVAKGYQFRTKLNVAYALHADKKTMPGRLTASALETLAIIAYEQPAAKSKVDDVRGVDSGGVIKTLLEKDFLRIVGRSSEPGQPLLYGTTLKFLEVFNLKNLSDLPSLAEIKDMYLKAEDEAEEASAQYFDPDEELIERVYTLSEEDMAIMGELDASLDALKAVEKSIEAAEAPTQPKETTEV